MAGEILLVEPEDVRWIFLSRMAGRVPAPGQELLDEMVVRILAGAAA